MKRLFVATVVGLLGLALPQRAGADSVEVIATAPSATLTIDGVSTNDVTFNSLRFVRGKNGFIVGAVDATGLEDALWKGLRYGRGRTNRPLVLRLSTAPGEAPIILLASVQPVDGESFPVYAFPTRHAVCDPASLQDSLTALLAQKSAIVSQIGSLENAIFGAELADATACASAYQRAAQALTAEIALAAFIGDVPLVLALEGKLAALAQSQATCDPAGVAGLESVLDTARSELAAVTIAIKAVLDELAACR